MENIINFYQITENIGTGGQPTIGELAKIAEENYSVVVNLAMHDSDNAISEEGDIVSSLGMKYIHIPVPFEAPTSDHLKNFFNVMDSFEEKKVGGMGSSVNVSYVDTASCNSNSAVTCTTINATYVFSFAVGYLNLGTRTLRATAQAVRYS